MLGMTCSAEAGARVQRREVLWQRRPPGERPIHRAKRISHWNYLYAKHLYIRGNAPLATAFFLGQVADGVQDCFSLLFKLARVKLLVAMLEDGRVHDAVSRMARSRAGHYLRMHRRIAPEKRRLLHFTVGGCEPVPPLFAAS